LGNGLMKIPYRALPKAFLEIYSKRESWGWETVTYGQ
jgi:hypothetical protein